MLQRLQTSFKFYKSFPHCSRAVHKLVWRWSASCSGMQSLPGKQRHGHEEIAFHINDVLQPVYGDLIEHKTHTLSPFSPLRPTAPC